MRAFCLLLFVAIASAHVCLLQPLQRGSLNGLNTVGTPDCGLTTGPCGGRHAEQPKQILKSGSEYTIVFQKNRDHYASNATGFFHISYEKAGHFGSFRTLAKIPDTSSPSLTLFSHTVRLPDQEWKHVIINVQYSAPSEGVVFYQCADVELKRFN